MKPLRFRLLRHHSSTKSYLIRASHPEGLTSPAYVTCMDVRMLRHSDIRLVFRLELRSQLEHLERRLPTALANPISQPIQP